MSPSPDSLPPLPVSFVRPSLEAVGFIGWCTWAQLRANDLAEVPGGPAAYVVYRPSSANPIFLEANPGGRFKGQDPSVSTDTLQAKWVVNAHTIYIGKADVARRRLKQFARFGAGDPVGHWGGRYIWQLAGSHELLVAWHPITWAEAARGYERRLLAHFSDLGGGYRPFANLTGQLAAATAAIRARIGVEFPGDRRSARHHLSDDDSQGDAQPVLRPDNGLGEIA